MPLPTFLIIGVPRAGTTSLAAYLAAHPDVYMADGKELHFFNGRYHLGLDWYSEHFQGKPAAVQRGEATPGYLFKPKAVELMARTLPAAKLVVVLRDPVDRAYSHYWLNQWRGIEPLTFEGALDAENSRLARRPDDPRPAYFGMGSYADQMRRLLSHYPPEQVHSIFFEDLKVRPNDVVLDLCRFLDIRAQVPSTTGDRHNHHGPVRSVRLATYARQLPGPVCRTVRRLNTRDAEYPAMKHETRATLSTRFAAVNRGLPDLIGKQPDWTGPQAIDE